MDQNRIIPERLKNHLSMTEREFQEEIRKFVTDRLTETEIDQLFVEIIKAPEWMDYLERVKIQYDLCREGLKRSNIN